MNLVSSLFLRMSIIYQNFVSHKMSYSKSPRIGTYDFASHPTRFLCIGYLVELEAVHVLQWFLFSSGLSGISLVQI